MSTDLALTPDRVDEAPHGPVVPDRRRLLALAIGGTALVVAGAGAGIAAHNADAASTREEARTEALAAARTRVPVLLSYEHATLTDDLDDALAQTTGSFRKDYGRVLRDLVQPTAEKRKISTTAQVSAAGVVRQASDDEYVVVLVFLNQATTAGKGAPTVTGSRVEVTMRHVGDAWKIAGLQPV